MNARPGAGWTQAADLRDVFGLVSSAGADADAKGNVAAWTLPDAAQLRQVVNEANVKFGAVKDGENAIQFGLTQPEIDEVWQRVQKIMGQVDSGDLPV